MHFFVKKVVLLFKFLPRYVFFQSNFKFQRINSKNFEPQKTKIQFVVHQFVKIDFLKQKKQVVNKYFILKRPFRALN